MSAELIARFGIVASLTIVVAFITIWYRRRSAADEALGAIDNETGKARWPDLPVHLRADAPATWIVFTTPMCASCNAVQSDLERAFPHHHVRKVDATEHPDVADAYAVRRAPTTIVADRSGIVVERLVGPEAVREFIGAVEDPAVLLG